MLEVDKFKYRKLMNQMILAMFFDDPEGKSLKPQNWGDVIRNLYQLPTESVRPAQIEIPNHHANTQLQPMTPESWRELSNWDKGRIEGWRRSM